MTAINRRRAYEATVDAFEAALAEFTGAPLVIATDCCTNALHVSLAYTRHNTTPYPSYWVSLPKRNYVGVAHAAWNAGYQINWTDEQWEGSYQLRPTPVWDSAKRFHRGMYQPGTLTCLSFGASKRLPVGKGGAILLDSQDAYDWIRPRTMDGRTPGENYQTPKFVTPAWRCNMTPDAAARGLDLLTYVDDDPDDTWEAYPDISKAIWE